MKRLIGFGCSHTWGDALSKEQNSAYPKRRGLPPHPQSWPYLLGEMLGRETINLSYPGESNKGISHKMFNFEFKEDDIVIPLWTHIGRHCIIDKLQSYDNTNYTRVNSWYVDLDESTDRYYKEYHTIDDELYQTICFIQSINSMIQPKVERIVNGFACTQVLKLIQKYSTNLPIYTIPFFEGYSKWGIAYDGLHIGEEGHNKFAMDLYTYLTQEPLNNNKII